MNNLKAIIYKKEKNPMQTGVNGDVGKWILEYPQYDGRVQLDFLNFVGSTQTKSQLHITFESKKDAIIYAKENNICYEVVSENPKKKFKAKSYANNFSFKAIKYY